MKYVTFFLLFIVTNTIYGQKEGQNFCEGNQTSSYFPLLKSNKFIIWTNTYYKEENIGTEILNGKTYTKYLQSWETGYTATLFLREENGSIFQYEETLHTETLRLPKITTEGKTWKTADSLATYKIISLKGKLKTPVCEYKNLLVLESSFKNGAFTFYYQKGIGYIGATQNGALISFIVPRDPEELLKEKE